MNLFLIDVYCLPSGSLGGSTVEACQLCPPGHYCHQRGKAEPSGQCAEGYYCPEGQSSERPQQHVCSVGHYCEKVSHAVRGFKLLSVIIVEYCMWCLPPWLCLLFCHDKCIAACHESLDVSFCLLDSLLSSSCIVSVLLTIIVVPRSCPTMHVVPQI